MSREALDTLLQENRLLVLVGSGGVGKTTVSAALGLRAARRGRKVLVITIDPARRLATSLGLSETGNAVALVNGAVDSGEGSFSALMLDARSTFDELIHRIAPDEATRRRILDNRVYRLLSESVAGSQNYMATEKLHEVMLSGRYDLVVLDTPPTSNALDFLESSKSLARFLDERVMRWFMPAKGAGRLFQPAGNVVMKVLGLLFGSAFMEDLLDFFDAFRNVYKGFRERALELRGMLREPGTRFAVVSTPQKISLLETGHLAKQLQGQGHRLSAWFVNQCGPHPGRTPEGDRFLGEEAQRELARLAGPEAAALEDALERAYHASVELSDRDQALLATYGPQRWDCLQVEIPRQADQVVELEALVRLADSLGDPR